MKTNKTSPLRIHVLHNHFCNNSNDRKNDAFHKTSNIDYYYNKQSNRNIDN